MDQIQELGMVRGQSHAEAQLLDVLESMSDAFISVDKNWQITRVNAREEVMMQLKRHEQIGKNFLDLFLSISEAHKTPFWIHHQKAMRERVAVHFTTFYAPFHLWLSVDAYPQGDGGLAIFFRDVTAQKQATERIETEKHKFEAIFSDSPASMALLRGPNFIFEKVNAKYLELMGGRDLIGLALADALPELVDQPFYDLLQNVFATGESFVGREMLAKLIRRPGGMPEDTYFDFTYSRVDDGEGKPYGVYIHSVEITDKVRARVHLETSEARLRLALAAHQEAVKARDELLSICSHELRTPVASMKLATQSFRRGLLKQDPKMTSMDRVRKMVEQSDRQLDRLTQLIDEMLDFSRISGGRLTLNPEGCNLVELVHEGVDRLLPQFDAVGSRISLDLPEEPVVGTWDRLRLDQVLTNLLSNALKYAAGTPVEVALQVGPDSAGFSVKDAGSGISEADLTRIFKPYERAVSVHNISGLGLGLYISRQFVEAHGGEITVESKVGEGSRFAVRLPRKVPS